MAGPVLIPASAPRIGHAFDVMAMASSAGGLAALKIVMAGLPADLPVAVAIVQHLDPHRPSLFAKILARFSPLPVDEAADGDVLVPGRAFLAPPDRHLLVTGEGTLALTRTGLVHWVRPSADILFQSVAAAYGSRAIAVVLSGTGLDGSGGLSAIKAAGGVVIAQDEATSQFFGMPSAAIDTGMVDFVLPLKDIAPALVKLVSGEHFDVQRESP